MLGGIISRRLALTVVSGIGSLFLAAYSDEPKQDAPEQQQYSKGIAIERDSVSPVPVDDSQNWWVYISHIGRVPQGDLHRMFSTDPRLLQFKTNPHVNFAYTGPAYTGFAQQKYASVAQPPAIVVMDSRAEYIYQAQGSQVPKTATELVYELNKAIAAYNSKVFAAKQAKQRAEILQQAERDYPPAGGFWRWIARYGWRPWTWGKVNRPNCPQPPAPQPQPEVDTQQPEVVEHVEEPQTPYGAFVVIAIAGLAVGAYLHFKTGIGS